MIVERIFNIFIYFENGFANEYGVVFYEVLGDDDSKTQRLLVGIETDQMTASRFKLAKRFSPEHWQAAHRLGDVLSYFEEAFRKYSAPNEPLYCLTPIVDGKPQIDQQISHGPLQGKVLAKLNGQGDMQDYLELYTEENLFRMDKLINADYFEAIKSLFNAKLYVSASKLLMSCIDTLAFVEFGDTPQNFTKWLDRFVDLKPLNVTSDEIWEFRNSLLHMSNLQSRKVVSGKVSPIMPFVAAQDTLHPSNSILPRPFNLYDLILAVAAGVEKWGHTYNLDKDKFTTFVERYDTIISDARLERVWVAKT